jgi:DNA-binding NtrC family response regulator
MAKILIVDDEKSIRYTLRDILEYEKYEVDEAKDGQEALELLQKNNYDVVLCDVKMPNMDGLELLTKAGEIGTEAQFIMISAHGNIETAVEATKKGAFDFIPKPPDLNRLLITVRNALDKSTLVTETKVLRKKISKSFDIVGESAAIRRVKDAIEKVAPTEARVLITGPNGSGKLFLDEIGDMSLSAQAKVLRALQESKITRVGGDKEIKVNVRVVAATNKDLRKEIEENRFREDLYHRLGVILIHVPPLDERKEDIPLLVDKFLKDIADDYGTAAKKVTPEAITYLQSLRWTGNIRELRNVVERLVILSGKEISEEDARMYAGVK